MTTGTKVFLAVFAALIGVMVLYYGVLMPGPSSLQMPAAVNAATHDGPVATSDTPLAAPSEPPAFEFGPLDGSAQVAGPLTQAMLPQAADEQPGIAPMTPPTEAAAPRVIAVDLGTPSREETVPASPPVANKPASIAANPPAAANEYIIKAGDTMSSIAEQWFGESSKWSLIARENPTVDPIRLVIGQKIRLPSKDAKPAPAKEAVSSGDMIFTVRSGDTLAKIAREYYGDFSKWKAIYELNRSVIGADPGNLKPGMKLKMPPPSKPASN